MANRKIYIHEFVFITGANRARYLHHMTANWSPIAQERRRQLCYGVWGVVGATGSWPQVVNIWEEDGFEGLADSFHHEFDNPRLQDPALAKWWAAAAGMRSGGFDRILLPHPESPTIEDLCSSATSGEVYAHELIKVGPGQAVDFLDAVMAEAGTGLERYDWRLVGAWRTLMGNEDECLLLWSIPTWRTWAAAEERMAGSGGGPLPRLSGLVRDRARVLLVDAPLSPLRTHRQPSREDRVSWED